MDFKILIIVIWFVFWGLVFYRTWSYHYSYHSKILPELTQLRLESGFDKYKAIGNCHYKPFPSQKISQINEYSMLSDKLGYLMVNTSKQLLYFKFEPLVGIFFIFGSMLVI